MTDDAKKVEARKTALALKYDQTLSSSPLVVAKGKGIIAENILAQAKEMDVPIQEDPTLIELLGNLEINQSIPEELFDVVAEVFAFIYRVDKKKKDENILKMSK